MVTLESLGDDARRQRILEAERHIADLHAGIAVFGSGIEDFAVVSGEEQARLLRDAQRRLLELTQGAPVGDDLTLG